MKKTSLFTRSLVLLLIGVCSLPSCISNEKIYMQDPPPFTGQTADIPFMAYVPASNSIATRGETGTVPENRIDDIHVLVFEKAGAQQLVYKGKAKNLQVAPDANSNNKVTFKATLPVGTEYTFMVLANAESKLSSINVYSSPAKTKGDVLALVQTLEAGSKWNSASSAIPMWGEKELNLTASSSPAFTLTRMMARINVSYNPEQSAPSNFQLRSIRVYNYNTAGTLVPAAGNLSPDKTSVVLPTLPASPGTQTGDALLYSDSDITDHTECKNRIYVFEAAHKGSYSASGSAWIDNPCIVVGGVYDDNGDGNFTEQPTYYRIDFIKKTTTNEVSTDTWLSLLRNFSYNVVISSVSGAGYNDPDVALKSAPINMKAGVLDWNDGGMSDIKFDGTFYLAVDRKEFVFPRRAVAAGLPDESNLIRIKTDYMYDAKPTDPKSGWKVDGYYTDKDGLHPMADPWLTLHPASGPPTGHPDAPAATAYFTCSENTGNTNREAWVYISAGRLRYGIHLVQRLLSIDLFELVNGVETPKDSMLFVIPHIGGKAHAARTFRVRWHPVNKPLATTNEAPVVWNPFEPGWITGIPVNTLPGPGAEGTIPGGSGMQEYVVNAPTVDDEELSTDPFYEKKSTYWFEVTNGDDREKKGITLHQVYYNIIVDTYRYRLDRKTYTMSVRSNTEWKITKVEEWLYNQNPATNSYPTPVMLELKAFDNLRVGTTGGPHVNGESIAFTVVNQESPLHEGKWGTVWVTFESPDGKFPPQRVPLVFSPEAIPVLTLGYSNDVRAFNVGKTSPYHNTSVFEMLSYYKNFSESDESIVKTAPLKFFAYNCEGKARANYSNNASDEYEWVKYDLKKWINLHKPAVIVISYSIILSQNHAKILIEYMRRGGAVIMYYGGDVQYGIDVQPFFMELFGLTPQNLGVTHTAAGNSGLLERYDLPNSGAVLTLNNIDHPILNGPFGDVRGDHFGLHIRRVGIKRSLIEHQVTSLCNSENQVNGQTGEAGYTYMFVHNNHNLFWVGNGMGTATYFHSYASSYPWYDPISVNSETLTPEIRMFGHNGEPASSTVKYPVHNSFVMANAMAWALSVSHYQHPSDNYATFLD